MSAAVDSSAQSSSPSGTKPGLLSEDVDSGSGGLWELSRDRDDVL
jgi:hypothetical protein